MTTDQASPSPLLEAILNLSRFHKEHERFYSTAPLETAVRLQRHARTLQALADRWITADPATRSALSPYEGAEDLNSEAAVALDGVLFLEGEGRPAEIAAMIGELRADADGFAGIGAWLDKAMQASWNMAAALLDIDGLADVMGERHRIISNDWMAAHMQALTAELLARAAEMLDRLDFTPAALRADLAEIRRRGYSISRGDATPGVGALGAPVFDATGRAVAALSVGGLLERVSPEREPEVSARLLACSRELSTRLGAKAGQASPGPA